MTTHEASALDATSGVDISVSSLSDKQTSVPATLPVDTGDDPTLGYKAYDKYRAEYLLFLVRARRDLTQYKELDYLLGFIHRSSVKRHWPEFSARLSEDGGLSPKD